MGLAASETGWIDQTQVIATASVEVTELTAVSGPVAREVQRHRLDCDSRMADGVEASCDIDSIARYSPTDSQAGRVTRAAEISC